MRTLVIATMLVAVTPAHAQPTDLVARSLVLDAGEIDARLSIEMNLLPRRFAQPLSLAPDLWYGVTDRWTVGVIHSNQSLGRIDSVATFCVRQLVGQCETPYHGSGVDVRWSWRSGALAIAPHGRVLLRGIDPIKPAVTLGAAVRWTGGRFAISSDPYLRLGLANLDRGNRAALVVPVWLAVQPTCRWLVAVHTGWDGELATIRDGWHIPVALVVRARVTAQVEIGVEAGYRSLLGPQNNNGQSAAIVTVGWRGPLN